MPHEPTREAASAAQLIPAASAFAQREMLAEAREALQGARTALALRADVGPAHWCDACLVALEIAVRGGDVPEVEAEAARLRSLSGGGRYWMEQARARIGEHANRIDPTRLDHVFAVLAGEANPAVPPREHPRPDDSHCPPSASPEPLAPSLAADALPATANDVSVQPAAPLAEGGAGLESDTPAFSADTRARRSTDTEDRIGRYVAPFAVVAFDTAGIHPEAPPRFSLARARAMAHLSEILTAAPGLKHSSLQRGTLVVLALSAVLWTSRSAPGVSTVLSRSSASAEYTLRTGNPARALQIASVPPGAGKAAPHRSLVLARALLAAGDTAGAVAAFARAAQTDSRGAVAWAAAETLARLRGHSASAADAYLLAFAAGLPAERAETVARAQELAGRPERAQRVRETGLVD